MIRNAKSALAIAALLAFAGAAGASEHYSDKRAAELQAANSAKISLAAAIATAEKQIPGGKAVEADFKHSSLTGWIYEVEVLNGTQKFDVKIDPMTGAVISSQLHR